MKKQIRIVGWLASGGNSKNDFTKKNALDCIKYLERYRGSGGGGDAGGDDAAVLEDGQEESDDVVSDKNIRRMLERMVPFMENAPGTRLFFSKERLDLLTMLTSNAVSGRLRWFMTEAQPDTYIAEIFDNIVTSHEESTGVDHNSSMEERRSASNKLTLDKRKALLVQYPAISARIHKLHQDAFWKYVLNGEDKPLGKSTHHSSIIVVIIHIPNSRGN